MKSRAERKAKLMAMAEAELEGLLDWMEAEESPNLEQIEEVVLRIRKRMGEELTQAVIENQAKVQPVQAPRCAACGKGMTYKGKKGKEISSLIGEVKLKRAYYYCDQCQTGLFPPRPPVKCEGAQLVGEHHP